MKQYVVVAGNIGAGKSTLVQALGAALGWKSYFEPVAENPFLEDYYGDMKRWAFHCQMYFLADRISMHRELDHWSGSVVQDRSLYEDAEIFAKSLYQQGYMSKREYETYGRVYTNAESLLALPDLIVYIRADVPFLQKRIADRNRDFEQGLDPAYLHHLNRLYENWIENVTRAPVMVLNAREYDILGSHTDLDHIVDSIRRRVRQGQSDLFDPGH